MHQKLSATHRLTGGWLARREITGYVGLRDSASGAVPPVGLSLNVPAAPAPQRHGRASQRRCTEPLRNGQAWRYWETHLRALLQRVSLSQPIPFAPRWCTSDSRLIIFSLTRYTLALRVNLSSSSSQALPDGVALAPSSRRCGPHATSPASASIPENDASPRPHASSQKLHAQRSVHGTQAIPSCILRALLLAGAIMHALQGAVDQTGRRLPSPPTNLYAGWDPPAEQQPQDQAHNHKIITLQYQGLLTRSSTP
jgi:hypothetical protein